jgi:hypothetical protein
MSDDDYLRMKTIRTRAYDGVLYATFDAPPLNLIGPEPVGDLAALVRVLSALSPYAWWSSTAPTRTSSCPMWT